MTGVPFCHSLPILRQGISLNPGIMFSRQDWKVASRSDPSLLILLNSRTHPGSNVGTGRLALVLRDVQEVFLTLAPSLQF